ncbi:guanosine polyphosphate pyrophosphohydrolase [Microtetraspora niveoalba]|uniref:guanosine polyphosphate pyrophosphohydrolase n=1 Tax=Microtetraspora niveoalba TaxID=46175 RepID=UPI00082C1E95|nr:guanosine polyphosphate pyrophosphohydrolase [Microtetraspora niveoalba]
MRANLLVIYTTRPGECRDFYSSLGMDFRLERHGDGPEHFAAVLPDGTVFEIYPALRGRTTGALRLGFATLAAAGLPPGRHLTRDPDDRVVEIHVRPAP